jgi:hypothetical protein
MIAVNNGRVGGHLAFLPADGFLSIAQTVLRDYHGYELGTLSQEQDEGE